MGWMKWSRIGMAFMAMAPFYAESSALVVKNDFLGTLDFYTALHFSGPASSPQVAFDAGKEISRLWNESRSQIFYRFRYYRARFFISVSYYPWSPADRGSCADNYIRVEQGDPQSSRSFYRMAGRRGTFYLSDDIGRSTTTAHEYGHGLGLDHDDLNQLTAPVPGIMFPRGTYVQSQFQWNRHAQPGAPGGSLNPKHRKVRPLDVLKLDLSKLNFTFGADCLGEGLPIPSRFSQPVPLHPPAPARLELERAHSPDVERERYLDQFDH
jgi:hypothetical protein